MVRGPGWLGREPDDVGWLRLGVDQREALPRGQGFWPTFLWQELQCELAGEMLKSESLLLTGLKEFPNELVRWSR